MPSAFAARARSFPAVSKTDHRKIKTSHANSIVVAVRASSHKVPSGNRVYSQMEARSLLSQQEATTNTRRLQPPNVRSGCFYAAAQQTVLDSVAVPGDQSVAIFPTATEESPVPLRQKIFVHQKNV